MSSFRTILAVAVLVAGCSGEGSTDLDSEATLVKRTVSTNLAGGYSVELTIPDDWAHSTTGGLVAARHGPDLDLSVEPSGPRIIVGVDHDVPGLALEQLPNSIAATAYGEVVDEPRELTLAGHPAASIAIRLDATVARFVAVTHDGTAHLITAEAPAASWPDDGPLIDEILAGSLRFHTSVETSPTTSSTQEPIDEPRGGEDSRRELTFQFLLDSPLIDPSAGTYVQALFDPTTGEEVWKESAALADEWCDGFGGLSQDFDSLMDLAWSANPAELELLYGSKDNLGIVVALQLEWRCPDIAEELLG